MRTNFPTSADEVLRIIEDAEGHRKFVWTAGKVLREAALWTPAEALAYEDGKGLLRRITGFLQEQRHTAFWNGAPNCKALAMETRLVLIPFEHGHEP